MMIVLPCIISECLFAQFAACPPEIKRMFQQMFRRDFTFDFVEICVHQFPRMWFEPQIDTDFHGLKRQNSYLCFIRVHLWLKIHADFKMCLIPRMGMTTQLGRWFSSYPISYTALSSK